MNITYPNHTSPVILNIYLNDLVFLTTSGVEPWEMADILTCQRKRSTGIVMLTMSLFYSGLLISLFSVTVSHYPQC